MRHPAEVRGVAKLLLGLADEARALRAAVIQDTPPGTIRDRLADSVFAQVATANGTTQGLVRLSLDHDEEELMHLAQLGMSERNPTLLAFVAHALGVDEGDDHDQSHQQLQQEWIH